MRTLPSVDDHRGLARRTLPRPVFDFVEGGAGDEVSVEANRAAFDAVRFAPHVLASVGACDLSTTFCGTPLQLPIMLAPTGLAGIVHPDGERAAAVVAAEHGTVSITSLMSTYTIEELAAAAMPPPWLQLYVLKDRGLTAAIVERAAAVGVPGLCLTVDTPQSSRRDRDLRNGWSVPPKVLGPNAVAFIRHPRWVARTLRHRRVVITNVVPPARRTSLAATIPAATASVDASVRALDRDASWDDLVRLREVWTGPLAVKGVLRADDARQAVTLGADAIIVSNHGGRQLDGARASLDALPEVVDAVGGAVDVVIDGGVRRGTDVVKALCLGAQACMIGRAWLWGLASGGTPGVRSVVDLLRAELEVALMLLGQRCVRALDPAYLAGRPAPGA